MLTLLICCVLRRYEDFRLLFDLFWSVEGQQEQVVVDVVGLLCMCLDQEADKSLTFEFFGVEIEVEGIR